MSNKLYVVREIVVRVRCVYWDKCSWEGKRKSKRMRQAMRRSCPKCGSPVEFVSAVQARNGVLVPGSC